MRIIVSFISIFLSLASASFDFQFINITSDTNNVIYPYADPLSQSWQFIVWHSSLEYPYNQRPSECYQQNNGSQTFTISRYDPPTYMNSIEPPTCNLIVYPSWNSGVWAIQADFFVGSGSSGVNILQIFGSYKPAAQVNVYSGNLWYFHEKMLASNIVGSWFTVRIEQDTLYGTVKIYVNGSFAYSGKYNGQGPFNFKCGAQVLTGNEVSKNSQVSVKNIQVLQQI